MKQVEPDFTKRSNTCIMAIVQDAETKCVLMHAYMNKEAWDKTIETGLFWRYSLSSNELMQKGATSGNTMKVVRLMLDCDLDCALIWVTVQGDGKACHTGAESCFTHRILMEGEIEQC